MARNRPCLTEQETIIRWDNEGKEASVYTYHKKARDAGGEIPG